jgi:hypothetical protein
MKKPSAQWQQPMGKTGSVSSFPVIVLSVAIKGLIGYAGGIWRKKWLLQHEFKISHGIQTLFDCTYYYLMLLQVKYLFRLRSIKVLDSARTLHNIIHTLIEYCCG